MDKAISTKPSSSKPEDFFCSTAFYDLPEEVTETIASLTLKDRSLFNYKTFFTVALQKHGLFLDNLQFHPEFPFLNVFCIHDPEDLPKEALCFFWYLFEAFTIAISFESHVLLAYLFRCLYSGPPYQSRHLFTLLEWFKPIRTWLKHLSVCPRPFVVIMFRRPCSFLAPSLVKGRQAIIYHSPLAFIQDWYYQNHGSKNFEEIYPDMFLAIRNNLANANQVDPATIPDHIMHNKDVWPTDHPIASKWTEILSQWEERQLKETIDPEPYDEDQNDDTPAEDQIIDEYEEDLRLLHDFATKIRYKVLYSEQL